MYYIYVLRCSDNSLYTGITNDFEKRYHRHVSREKSAAKYTKSRSVIGVEAIWQTETKSAALKLEYRIKKLTKTKKERLIAEPSMIDDLGIDDSYVYLGTKPPSELIN